MQRANTLAGASMLEHCGAQAYDRRCSTRFESERIASHSQLRYRDFASASVPYMHIALIYSSMNRAVFR